MKACVKLSCSIGKNLPASVNPIIEKAASQHFPERLGVHFRWETQTKICMEYILD